MKNLLSTKHEKLHPKLVKHRHRKFLRDGMEGSHVKEYCHKIERKSLNIITGYFSSSDETQELVNNDHHPVILTNDTSQISPSLKDLCAKGASFVPAPINYDWTQLQLDYDTFASRMRTRYMFRGKSSPPRNDSPIPCPPKKPSMRRAPKTNSAELETFLSTVEKKIFIDMKQNYVKDNLTKDERRSLTTWRRDILFNPDSSLLLRSQEKGNRFVVVDKQTDIVKANHQIERSSFVKLNYDPTKDFILNVKQWANKWVCEKEISAEWRDYIVNNHATPGKNATSYKTHKTGMPVRLLTSGCNTAIENLSRFIEIICSPLTEVMQCCIKDTSHLLDIIDTLNEQPISNHTQLVSLDIVNMFPSIDNQRGIQAVQDIPNTRAIKKPYTDCIMEGLKLCLYNNNSVFGNENLLQTNGTAPGAPNSCSYADIAVVSIDQAIMEQKETAFPEILYFGWYRDDCLVLWDGTDEKLHELYSFINTLNPDLKFTVEIGNQLICFLDLRISTIENKLTTTDYSKPTDSHLYLHADSCHKKSSIKGIQKGVALRLRHICSSDNNYTAKSIEYTKYFVNREHDLKSV